MGVAGYIVTYAILLGCAVVCFMKGKIRFAALGIVLPILWIVGAVRPAKPDSAWAEHFGDASSPLR